MLLDKEVRTDINDSRRKDLDIVSGIMIIYMVYGHMVTILGFENPCALLWRLLFCFMPWFYYKSGMFFKSKSLRAVMAGSGKKLLIPYCQYSLFGIFCYWFILFWQKDPNWIHFFLTPIKDIIYTGALGGNAPLWFLPSLCAVHIIFQYLMLHRWRAWMIMTFSAVASIILYGAKIVFYGEAIYPYYLFNIIAGTFFYSFGYLLRERQYSKYVILLAIIVYSSILYFNFSSLDFRANDLREGSYLLYLPFALSAIVIINYLAKITLSLKSAPLILQFVGRNSMLIFAIHYPILLVTSCLLSESCMPPITKFLVSITILSIIVGTILLIRKLKSNFSKVDTW